MYKQLPGAGAGSTVVFDGIEAKLGFGICPRTATGTELRGPRDAGRGSSSEVGPCKIAKRLKPSWLQI